MAQVDTVNVSLRIQLRQPVHDSAAKSCLCVSHSRGYLTIAAFIDEIVDLEIGSSRSSLAWISARPTTQDRQFRLGNSGREIPLDRFARVSRAC